MIPLPAGYDFIYWHWLGGMRDTVGFCVLFTCTANQCFVVAARAVARTEWGVFSSKSPLILKPSAFSWPVTFVRFRIGRPKLKDSLFRIWTGCTPLQLHLSSAQVRRGEVFLSCWTSSVINKAGARSRGLFCTASRLKMVISHQISLNNITFYT